MSDHIAPGWHAWAPVAALSVAQLVSWGCLTYAFSLMVLPMEAELGWRRADITGALSAGLLSAGLLAYPIGAWIDRHGGRLVMGVGSGLAVALLAAWSQVHSLWAFYLIWIGLGAASAACLYEPVFAVLTRLFPASFRAKITVVTLVGGFASTLFIPLVQVLIEALGWRDTLLVLAGLVALVCVPVHVLSLRHDWVPALPASGGTVNGAVRLAMRRRAFWGLMLCFTAYYGGFAAMTFHMVPILTERGSGGAGIMILTLIGPAQVAGRAMLLALGRRVRTAWLGQGVTLLFTAAVGLLLAAPASPVAMVAFALGFGVANGLMTILRGTAVPDLLGRHDYGAINGALSAPVMVVRAAAPVAAALLWSVSGSYEVLLWVIAAGGILAFAGFRLAVHRGAPA
jgi:MFS family permease